MRIKGEIEIEGVKLYVDIEAPDGDRVIFVTNLTSSFLVVPKQRWPVEFLELRPETIEGLREAGVDTLGDLVDDSWQLTIPEGLKQHQQEIGHAVAQLREIAMTFEEHPEPDALLASETFPLPEEESRALTTVSLSLNTQLASIGVPERICAQLLKTRNIGSIRELLQLGRRKLVMTDGIKLDDVQTIERRMVDAGVDWKTPTEPVETGAVNGD